MLRMIGGAFILVGLILTITVVGAAIGIPLMLLGLLFLVVGHADLMMRRADGMLAVFYMVGLQIQPEAQVIGSVGTEWIPVAIGDFNGDGRADLLIRSTDGTLRLFLLNGNQLLGNQEIGQVGTEWRFVGKGDFNGDGRADFLLRRADGTLVAYLMNGFQILAGQVIGQLGTDWESCYGLAPAGGMAQGAVQRMGER